MNKAAAVKKILFISLSNIGDAILTLPALDFLRQKFPESKITVMAGPRPKELFCGNPHIDRLIVYDKRARLKEKIKLFRQLNKEKFDLVADLRNSFFGAFLSARYRTSPLRFVPKNIRHMKDRHLYRIRDTECRAQEAKKHLLSIKPEDEAYIQKVLEENNIKKEDRIVVVAAGARSHIKRWAKEKFAELISSLIKEFGVRAVLVGDKDDIAINKYISEHMPQPLLDLTGKASLAQAAALLKRARLLITNDSAVLHLGSYLDIPIVALFGPTDELKYGPWSRTCAVVKKGIFCRPCEKAQCRFGTLECLNLVKVEDVLRQVREMLNSKFQITNSKQIPNSKSKIPNQYKRILIARTDRIGDVVLSTPVIQALRQVYPSSYIAMMVSPSAKDIVEGNPYLDEVIIYDKQAKHKSWAGSIKFALNLKKKRFDLAVILHPTNRAHLAAFLAGIPRRIGYRRKMGFLLTDRVSHNKQLGQKHELDYSLDLLRCLGIEPKEKNLFMPIRPESEIWLRRWLEQEQVAPADKLLVIHPAASCPSKIWPGERFAQVADKLAEKYGFKAVLIAGPKDIRLAGEVAARMRRPPINLAGKISLSQLASVLKRCRLFISNDSGPVHIATAVATPVISIFGRNQKGLSPLRWGPLGKKDKFLHKEVGCIQCLAHNCKKGFACLKAITIDEVIAAADEILKS